MRLSIFPLPGAILFPGLALPLHIFEPRYRALASEDRRRWQRVATGAHGQGIEQTAIDGAVRRFLALGVGARRV